MDEQYIRRHNIIDRYLLRQLSDREAYEFEEYYFEHPEMLKELELTRALQDALRQAPQLRHTARPPPSWRSRLWEVVTMPAWGGVAAAAAGILAIALIAQQRTPHAPTLQPLVRELSLYRTRGEAVTGATIQAAQTGVVAIRIDTLGLDPTTLTGTLSGPGVLIADLPLAFDAEDEMSKCTVPAGRMPAGDYVIEVHDGRGEHLSYIFRVEH
jgi:hypothetical protein